MVYNIVLKKDSYVIIAGIIMETMNPHNLKQVEYETIPENNIIKSIVSH